MDLGAEGWALLALGGAAGVVLTLMSGAVRDAVLDAVDAVYDWWWGLVDGAHRGLVRLGLLTLCGLAAWGAVSLLPHLDWLA
jgi:hypothetical protein